MEKQSFFSKFKELWANPRYKALIELGLYIAFFGIIFIYVSLTGSPSSNNYSNVEEKIDYFEYYKNMDSYEYNVLLSDSITGITNITGTFYNNISTYNVLGHIFTINGNLVTSKENKSVFDYISIDPLLLTRDNITNSLNDSYLVNKTEYSGNSYKYVYSVPIRVFAKNYYSLYQNNIEYIEITVYVNNDVINIINIDLFNLMKYTNSLYTNYSFKIEYTNINNIKSVVTY